jgi:hypothetical protein
VRLAPDADEGQHGALDDVVVVVVDRADDGLREVQGLLELGRLDSLLSTDAPGDVVVLDDLAVEHVLHGHLGV